MKAADAANVAAEKAQEARKAARKNPEEVSAWPAKPGKQEKGEMSADLHKEIFSALKQTESPDAKVFSQKLGRLEL